MPSSSTQHFLILGANTPWVGALARALAARGHGTNAVGVQDWLTARRTPARPEPMGNGVAYRSEWWLYPPGYAGRFEPLFRPLLSRRLRGARAKLGAGDASEPWVIVPYPWFAGCARGVPDERLIYYNLDDYTLYRPARAELICRREAELVQRAALTLCLSQTQTETLRHRFPGRADAIHHFPLGVVESLLNPRPGEPIAAPTVGYVGNLIDRVDWRFVAEVARLLPEVEFVFVGGLDGFGGGGTRPDWRAERDAALALANVRRVGPVPQAEVAAHYWNFGVSWIPYATDHAFNRASCPTKIMDSLASGRPVVSTDLPECRLYPEWISIAPTAAEAAALMRRQLATLSETAAQEKSRRQVEFVRRHHTWAHRAEWLEERLTDEAKEPGGPRRELS